MNSNNDKTLTAAYDGVSRNALIEQTFSLSCAPIRFLLLLRIIVDVEEPAHSLAADIQDLSAFPERLEGSYRQEWVMYIKRQLHSRAFNGQQRSDAAKLSHFMQHQYATRGDEIQARLVAYWRIIDTAQTMNQCDNVLAMPSPLKRRVESLLKA